MPIPLDEGARIVIHEWLRAREDERITIISDELHVAEAMAMREQAKLAGASPIVILVESSSPQCGELFDDRFDAFLSTDAIVGATHNSIMTTRAIRDSVRAGARFLSVPLSTNDGISLLQYDFIKMNIDEVNRIGSQIRSLFIDSSEAHVTTDLGTDIQFSIKGRLGNVFNGLCDQPGVSTSASFEFSVSVVENKTEGVVILDGSMGYIGLVEEPVRIVIDQGRIVSIEQNASGRKLAKYLSDFQDERMYVIGELGIGLNKMASCAGRSYIEDECSYGTFHIGIGRNISLGGQHYANGHFDLVMHRPTIKVDAHNIMKDGKIEIFQF